MNLYVTAKKLKFPNGVHKELDGLKSRYTKTEKR
jgi:hypothetical protein